MWTSAPGPTTQLDLLVEEHRHLGRLHAGLGDVVGVVEGDRQVLARPGGAEQPTSASGRRSAPSPSSASCVLAARRRRAPRPVPAAARATAAERSATRSPSTRPSLAPASVEKRQSLTAGVLFAARRRSPPAPSAAAGRPSVLPSTIASPPFFIFTLAPVSRATSSEKSGSWPTSSTSPRPGRQPRPVERPAAQLVGQLGLDARARAQASRAVSAARTLGLVRQASTSRPARPGPARPPRPARSPFSVSRRAASSPSPSSASPCRSR